MVEEEVRRAERHHVSGGGLVVVHGDVGRAQELHVHKVTTHGFSELLNVVGRNHDGSKAVIALIRVAEASGEA